MPKIDIDYSKTIIYKICCNDTNVTDCYVGRTCNLTKRKYRHKHNCNNNVDIKLYQVINTNGGWSNWTMSPLEECSCENQIQAQIKEREYYEKLKANLNTNVPNRSQLEYYIANKNKLVDYANNYNKQNQNIRNKQYNCECGGKYTYLNKATHKKTQKHINYCFSIDDLDELQD